MKISLGGRRLLATAIIPTCSSAFQHLATHLNNAVISSRGVTVTRHGDLKSFTPAKQYSCVSRLFGESDKLSSYEVDTDTEIVLNGSEEISSVNGEHGDTNGSTNGPINGSSSSSSQRQAITSAPKYQSLLDKVGLSSSLKQATKLPHMRTLTSNDIFCNRELKLSGVRAIGFDMDYTLAQYQQPAFDKLAFDGAKEKLVNVLGYPAEVLDFEYDHEFWVRGLIIDTQRGNFLKIDRHKYVRVAYHGFEAIDSSTRKFLYSRSFNKIPSFSEKSFVNMDTLFQHVDAHLFAHLINLKDKGDSEFLDMKTYDEIYKQVRECVDLCHRDGVIKDEVARNPDKYIVLDDALFPMLQSFRDAGIKVFLLTNSYWEYTSVAMNYLYHKRKVDDQLKNKNDWMDLFDLVVVGSCKPAYLVDPYLNLFRVKPEDGSLLNTDGLFEIEALGEDGAEKFLNKGKVFQGGNWMHLQKMLGTEAGEEILYVGDHLFADVLRSKRTLGWRTGLIVPEIVKEMEVFSNEKEVLQQITDLRKLRDELEAYADLLKREMPTHSQDLDQMLAEIEADDQLIKNKLITLTTRYHTAFHPIWGQMFLSGYQDSRFAFYVQNYACVYTSKATNLGLVSTNRSFRTSGEMLPHDKILADPTSYFTKSD
eukprot:CAMPEP_0172500614 /NCGR_PEP_ID=MMETSP1066-20121228/140821_1 /TAXON_ID=671091 /ORGANISM="Coscinodiscus wailesii, Strain CCMP2513" /LENGTH=647 /DNA_ID=CAMNT_0013274943 /DNA_START=133 /DNA_END=2076 /DNA_ORIENTATION=-